MTTASKNINKQTVNIRSIALPTEHGGWSLLLEPLILGLILAFSWVGLCFAFALLLGFLTHQPAKIFIKDLIKQRQTRRSQVSLYFLVGYGLVGLILALPALISAPSLLWWMLLVLTPFIIVQLTYDFQNKSRELIPELCGAIALSGTVSLITILGKLSWQVSILLWLLVGLRAITSIFFVRTLFRKQRGKPAAVRLTYVLHFIAIGFAVLLALIDLTPYLAILSFVILLLRAWQSIESPIPLKPKTVGIREIAYGIVTIVCIAVGFSFG